MFKRSVLEMVFYLSKIGQIDRRPMMTTTFDDEDDREIAVLEMEVAVDDFKLAMENAEKTFNQLMNIFGETNDE